MTRGFHVQMMNNSRSKWALLTAAVVAFIFYFHGRARPYFADETGEILSTCSHRADARGFHQNVVSYSLYGPDSSPSEWAVRYLKPLHETARRFPDLYPGISFLTVSSVPVLNYKLACCSAGWIMRIYHNESDASLQSFAAYPHVDLCNVTRIAEDRGLGGSRKLFGMTWRFLPLLDTFVDRFMSRDCDSVIFPRETAAVREWSSHFM